MKRLTRRSGREQQKSPPQLIRDLAAKGELIPACVIRFAQTRTRRNRQIGRRTGPGRKSPRRSESGRLSHRASRTCQSVHNTYSIRNGRGLSIQDIVDTGKIARTTVSRLLRDATGEILRLIRSCPLLKPSQNLKVVLGNECIVARSKEDVLQLFRSIADASGKSTHEIGVAMGKESAVLGRGRRNS